MKKRAIDYWLALEWALFLYIVVASILSNMLMLPEIVKSFLSLPTWLLFPYFFGEFIKNILAHLKIDFYKIRGTKVFSVFLGVYSLTVLAFFLKLLDLPIIIKNLPVPILFLAFLHLAHKTLKKEQVNTIVHTFSTRDVIAIASCILISVIPAAISRSALPFPYGTIETISIPFDQYQPAVKLTEHGYMQHYRVYDYLLLGFCSRLFNIDPLSFIWSASFLMMAIYSIGLFLFSFSISKNRGMALLTALVGSFLNMWPVRDIPILFKANVFLYILYPLALYLSYENTSRKEYEKKDVLLTLLLLATIIFSYYYLIWSDAVWPIFVPKGFKYPPREWRSHIWIPITSVTTAIICLSVPLLSRLVSHNNDFLIDNAPFLSVIMFSMLLLMNPEVIAFILCLLCFVILYHASRDSKHQPLLYILALGVLVFVLFQHYVIELPLSNPVSSLVSSSLAGAAWSVTFSERLTWITKTANSDIINCVFLTGIVATLCSRKKNDALMISTLSLTFFFYFLPESHAYRFIKELSPIMAYIVSNGLMKVFNFLFNLQVNRKTMVYSILCSLLIISLIVPELARPLHTRYYESTLGKPMVAEYEYYASRWLKENTPENAIIVSDYVTMQLLTPLSCKLWITAVSFRVKTLSDYDLQTVWYIKNEIFSTHTDLILWEINQTRFWHPYIAGDGDLDVRIENNYEISGNTDGSLRIEITDGTYSNVGIHHTYEETQDWSKAHSIFFYWCGQNTKDKWQVNIEAPDVYNRFVVYFDDDFKGWGKKVISLDMCEKVGSPNLSRVKRIEIRNTTLSHNIWWLGKGGINIAKSHKSYDTFGKLIERMHSSQEIYCERLNISKEEIEILIVITPRTIKWVNQPDVTEVWFPPNEDIDPMYLETFEGNDLFELIYSDERKIYVFKVKGP